MKTVIRVPGRAHFYMTGTGWFQTDDCEGDPVRVRLRELVEQRANADGSISVPIDGPEDPLLIALWIEGDYFLDSCSWGDNSMDDLADQNAAKALLRRAAKLNPNIAQVVRDWKEARTQADIAARAEGVPVQVEISPRGQASIDRQLGPEAEAKETR